MHEIARKIINNIYMIRNNKEAIKVHASIYLNKVYTSAGGATIPFPPQNSYDSLISDSIAWYRAKICMQYTYAKR